MSTEVTPVGAARAGGSRKWPVRILLLCLTAVLLLIGGNALRKRWTRKILPAVKIAVMAPLSGSQASHGRAILNAVQLSFDEVNRQGGIAGHRLQIVSYDDQSREDVAVRVAGEAGAGGAVAVIGHLFSNTSAVAGPIYRAARIPAITASANDPSITENNPYYFRAVMDNSSQGHTLAAYSAKVLKNMRASVLYSDEPYGRTLLAAFSDEFDEQGGTLESRWKWNPQGTAKEHAALISQVAEEIASGEGGVVVLAVTPNTAAKEALTALRRTGVNPLILGGSWLGTDFPSLFRDEPEEKLEPGYFTNNAYIATPVIPDIAPDRAADFFDRYYRAYHEYADEYATQYYDAALLLAGALRDGGARLAPESRDYDRERIRSWLAAQTSQSSAVRGLTGPIYFDESQSLPRPPRMGRCVEGDSYPRRCSWKRCRIRL